MQNSVIKILKLIEVYFYNCIYLKMSHCNSYLLHVSMALIIFTYTFIRLL
jgi:hypothetical protein